MYDIYLKNKINIRFWYLERYSEIYIINTGVQSNGNVCGMKGMFVWEEFITVLLRYDFGGSGCTTYKGSSIN